MMTMCGGGGRIYCWDKFRRIPIVGLLVTTEKGVRVCECPLAHGHWEGTQKACLHHGARSLQIQTNQCSTAPHWAKTFLTQHCRRCVEMPHQEFQEWTYHMMKLSSHTFVSSQSSKNYDVRPDDVYIITYILYVIFIKKERDSWAQQNIAATSESLSLFVLF